MLKNSLHFVLYAQMHDPAFKAELLLAAQSGGQRYSVNQGSLKLFPPLSGCLPPSHIFVKIQRFTHCTQNQTLYNFADSITPSLLFYEKAFLGQPEKAQFNQSSTETSFVSVLFFRTCVHYLHRQI